MDETEANKHLAAFADGELDTPETLRVLEHMAADPVVTKRVIHQQQLRQAVGRVISQNSSPAPEALRQKIQQLAASRPRQPNVPTAPLTGRRTGSPSDPAASKRAVLARWVPLAAALIALSAFIFLTRKSADHPISQARYAMFINRHGSCSRKIELLMHTERFPQNITKLPSAVAGFLDNPLSSGLDLSAIGYEFHAVGECNVPGGKSVHLIYRAKDDPSGQDTISLWIRQYRNSPDIEPDRPYLLTGVGVTDPLILWRQQGMVFYLVGNSLASVETAKNLLALAR